MLTTASPNSRDGLIAQLEAAKREQSLCMGGVDPVRTVQVSRRITELRLKLRDDPTMIRHLAAVVKGT